MNKLKDILKIKKSIWYKLGIYIKKWITQDAIKGLTQGDKVPYKNSTYKDYKKRGMKAKTLNRHVKPYDGVSIKNRRTGFVNMMLTGQLFAGLFPVKALNNGIVMSYKEKDEKKIEGNEARGVNIRTLNEKNQKKALKYYSDALEKNIKEYTKKEIIIKI